MRIELKDKRVHQFMRDMFAQSVESYLDWFDGLNEELGGQFIYEPHVRQWKAATAGERGLWLTGKLWNDQGIMPSSLCNRLGLPQGSRYSQGARKQRTKYRRRLLPAH